MHGLQRIIDQNIATLRGLADLAQPMDRAADLVADCLSQGHKLLACGNGGSAAEAAHLVTEFVVRFTHDRPPYAAVALADSGSTLTAAGNDYGFDHVFERQTHALAKPGDLLVAFSTSGQSKNILLALDAAAELSIQTIAFLGRDGGPAKARATLSLIVPSPSTARIQEAHTLLVHALCQLVEERLGHAKPDTSP